MITFANIHDFTVTINIVYSIVIKRPSSKLITNTEIRIRNRIYALTKHIIPKK
jgi:hypothetical protein